MEESLKGKRPEQLFPKQQRKLGKGLLGITSGLEAYDILKNLDNIKPDITLKQLLAISPECRATLNSALVRKRTRTKEICEVSLEPRSRITNH